VSRLEPDRNGVLQGKKGDSNLQALEQRAEYAPEGRDNPCPSPSVSGPALLLPGHRGLAVELEIAALTRNKAL